MVVIEMKKILLFITSFLLIFGLNSSAFAFVNFTKSPNFLVDEDYDMIIISPSVFSIELQPLIDHKNSRNIDTILMTVEEIYLSYLGRDKPEQIKYFIKYALDNWNIEYVLLVGGAEKLPGRYTHIYFEYDYQDEWVFLSDLYYADIYDKNMVFSSWDSNENDIFAEYNWSGNYDELDLYPDVKIGRLACVNEDEVTICVNKIITYETEKAYEQYWFRNVVYLGGDSLLGDEEQIDEGEYVNEQVINILDGFSSEKIWASNGKLYQSSNINNAINNGAGFVFFNGHGHTDIWATHPHESNIWIPLGYYTNSHVSSLINGNKLPIVISDACFHCQYNVASDCFGWNFITNPNGGAIAFLGGTDIDVSYGGVDIITKGIERLCLIMATNYMAGDKTFGDLWSNGINCYISDEMDEIDYITVEEFQPFGDPSLLIASDSIPPVKPSINGPDKGSVGVEYFWTFLSNDPNNDDIKYIVDWGDGYIEETDCMLSGQSLNLSHIYSEKGVFMIKVKAKECTEDGLESGVATLNFNVPRNRLNKGLNFNFFIDLLRFLLK